MILPLLKPGRSCKAVSFEDTILSIREKLMHYAVSIRIHKKRHVWTLPSITR